MAFNRVDLIFQAKDILKAVIEEQLYKKFGKNITGKFKVNTVMVAVDLLVDNTSKIDKIVEGVIDQDGQLDKQTVALLIEDELAFLKKSIDVIYRLMEDPERLYEVLEGFFEFINHSNKENVMTIWERYFSEAKGLIIGGTGA